MRTTRIRLIGSLGAVILVAGCGGGAAIPSSPNRASEPPSAAPVQTAAGGSAAGVSSLDLRFANFIAAKGAAAPAVDIYDDSLKNSTGAVVASAKPLVANLAYGAISSYVHPELPAGGSPLHFYEMPAGSRPASSGAQAPQFAVAVDGDDQATLILTWDSSDPPTATSLLAYGGIGFASVVEKGDGAAFNANPGPPAPPPAAGQALLLASTNYLPQGVNDLSYLLIDDSCAAPLNGDPNEPGVPYIFAADGATPKSAFALFAVSAGTHHVAVASEPQGPTPTCKDLTARQDDQTVTLTAGEEAYAWVYGTSATDAHVAIAPLAP